MIKAVWPFGKSNYRWIVALRENKSKYTPISSIVVIVEAKILSNKYPKLLKLHNSIMKNTV